MAFFMCLLEEGGSVQGYPVSQAEGKNCTQEIPNILSWKRAAATAGKHCWRPSKMAH